MASVLATWLAAPAVAAAACGDGAAASEPPRGDVAAIVCEINAERRGHDLPPVRMRDDMRRAGERHARDMVRAGYFSHVGTQGETVSDRLRATGYLGGGGKWAVGEVLAWGTGWKSRPPAIVRAWMASRPHRRVLLRRRYRDIGVGVADGTPVGATLRPAATYAVALGAVSR